MSARQLFIDIETKPALGYIWQLKTEYVPISMVKQPSAMLCFVAKWRGEKKIHFASEYHDGRQSMLEQVHALLDQADHIIHWNGDRFDRPWINGELAKDGFTPPSPYKTVDLMKEHRRQFKQLSYKLEWTLTDQWGLPGKIDNGGFRLWRTILESEDADELRKAWNKMRLYNRRDVTALEDVYDKALPWLRGLNLNLYRNDVTEEVCPNCESARFHRRGYAYTATSRYPRMQCQDCGTWFRGRHSDGVTATRNAT